MLFKEDIEQSFKRTLNDYAVGGDTIRAFTELYNSLPSREATVSQLTTRDELQDLADELNEAEPIDWEDNNQAKIFIEYHHIANRLVRGFAYSCRGLNIYSTNERFLEIAKERIGEDRLIKLFKEGI